MVYKSPALHIRKVGNLQKQWWNLNLLDLMLLLSLNSLHFQQNSLQEASAKMITRGITYTCNQKYKRKVLQQYPFSLVAETRRAQLHSSSVPIIVNMCPQHIHCGRLLPLLLRTANPDSVLSASSAQI